MPIAFQCLKCRYPINAPDAAAGRRSKCPKCGAPVTVPDAAGGDDDPFGFAGSAATVSSVAGRAVTAPGEEPDDPRQKAELERLRKESGWQSTAGGLRQVWWGSALLLLAGVSFLLAFPVMTFGGGLYLSQLRSFTDPAEYRQVASSLTGLMGILLFIFAGCAGAALIPAMLLRLIGLVRCLKTPAATGSRGLAMGALAGEVLPYLGCCVNFAGQYIHPLLSTLGSAMTLGWVLSTVFLLLFLRQIGSVLGIRELPRRVLNYAIWFIGCVIAVPLLTGLYSAFLWLIGSPPSSEITSMLAFVGFLGLVALYVGSFLIVIVKYLNLVGLAGDELRKRMGRYWI